METTHSSEGPTEPAATAANAGREEASLLWPSGWTPDATTRRAAVSDDCAADLELDCLIDSLCLAPFSRPFVKEILLDPCTDERVIAHRHAVLEDILSSSELARRLEALLPKIDALHRHHLPREKGELLHEIAWRLGELEIFMHCVQELASLLDSTLSSLRSEGFHAIRQRVSRLLRDETVQHLFQELPGMLSQVRGTRSITIGINVDSDFQPSGVTLLSINADRFDDHSPSFLNRLFGKSMGRGQGKGITPLHEIPTGDDASPLLVPLFRDLSEVVARSLKPVAAALQRFKGVRTLFLDQWGQEIAFFLGAAKMIHRLQSAGLPFCRPQVSEMQNDAYEIHDSYNIVLALKIAAGEGDRDLSSRIVRNDVALGAHEVSILTGPNQGGKTTYMQAVGLVHVMCQAGLYVPGTCAKLCSVDAIYTHFPAIEQRELDTGRFAEEVKRLGEMFAHATPQSLILLNESLTTTSPRESLELARELVSALQMLGARAVYTTHLYELAFETDDFNAKTRGVGKVASLVARFEQKGNDIRFTFKIESGPPAGSSHAREVASRYGISYTQLVEVLRNRGIVT
ncbi:MAG: hypothetical protein ABSF77_20700 [Spirochaetia bacterium]